MVLKWVDTLETGLIALLSAACLTVACLAILGRYALPQLPLDWTLEVSVFLFNWALFISGAQAAGKGGHVRVDTFVLMMPRMAALLAEALAILIGIGIGLFMIFAGWGVVEEAIAWDERTTSSLRLPVWIYYLSMPVGGILLVFHLTVRLVGLLRNGKVEAAQADTQDF